MATPANTGRVLTESAYAPVLSGPAAPPSRPLVEETVTGDPDAQHPCCSSGPRIRRLLVGRFAPAAVCSSAVSPHVHTGGQNRPVCFSGGRDYAAFRAVSPFRPRRGNEGERQEGFAGLGSLPALQGSHRPAFSLVLA